MVELYSSYLALSKGLFCCIELDSINITTRPPFVYQIQIQGVSLRRAGNAEYKSVFMFCSIANPHSEKFVTMLANYNSTILKRLFFK